MIAGPGLTSCGISKTYSVYTDQIAPTKDDLVEIEVGEGLDQPLVQAGDEVGDQELWMELAKMEVSSATVSTSQNAPELPRQDSAPAPTIGFRQNAPELAPKPESAVSARQNAPELPAKPEPKPEAKPAAVSMRQNAPELPAKPEAKPAAVSMRQNAPELPAKKEAKPEPKPAAVSTRQNAPELPAKKEAKPAAKPATVSTKQNAPELPAKKEAKPAAKPATVSTKQNAPELTKTKAKPEPKPAPKPAAKPAAVSTKQNAPELAKTKAKPAPKPAAKTKPAPKVRQPIVVTLKAGDSLVSIARKHGVSLNALYKENGINASTRLRSGMQLRIPKRNFFRRMLRLPWYTSRNATPAPVDSSAPTPGKNKRSRKRTDATKPKMRSYTVKPGDTISEIAKKYNVSSSAIIKANDLSSREVRSLRDGRKLRIPSSR